MHARVTVEGCAHVRMEGCVRMESVRTWSTEAEYTSSLATLAPAITAGVCVYA